MISRKEFQAAKHFYFKVWKGNEEPSSAFDGEAVKVIRAGWDHILFSPKRKNMDSLKRLSLLPYAKDLLETSLAFQEYRKVGLIEYWSLEGVIEMRRIRVIVRSVDGRAKHFFSVFEIY